MFQNPSTIWIEILVIALTLAFLGIILGVYIYKKVHHLPTGECQYCHKGKEQMLKEYHKLYSKNPKSR